MRLRIIIPLVFCSTLAAVSVRAEVIGGNPGPAHNYVCPNSDGKGPLDCYFDAVAHLYTMCRHVKSIEIIEFGYEKSEEGANGAKSEYCMVKQRINIIRPYQARAARGYRLEAGRRGHAQPAGILAGVARRSSNGTRASPTTEYKARVAKPYDDFRDRTEGIRKIVAVVKENTTPPPAPKSGREKKKSR